jgi:predicted nucleic acid-binding protein
MTPAPKHASGPLYAETSAVLRVLAEGDQALAAILAQAGQLVTSALTFVEAERGMRRALVDGRLDAAKHRDGQRWLAQFARSCEIIQLTDAVLERAKQQFPIEPVRTLDALHLATVKLWDEQIGNVAIASTDRRVRDNAFAWGLTLLPT